MSKPTIRDVARVAGVSIKTVSRVTNADPEVAVETARRVRAAIEELGYTTNPLARSLRTGHDDAIGLIVESFADPFFASVTEGVEQAARRASLFVLIATTGRTPDEERAVVAGLLNRSVRGLIVVPRQLDYGAARLPLGAGGVPVVFIDRPPTGLDADVVVVDNAGVAQAATEHLVAHGHRRIAFVGSEPTRYPVAARLDGYHRALAVHGIGDDPTLVIAHRNGGADDDLAATVLAGPSPATAIFGANAVSAISAVRELHRIERTDVAVVSFDDFPMADSVRPAITVNSQDPTLMGREAFRLLRDRLAGRTHPPRVVVLPTTFVARGSGELAPAWPFAAVSPQPAGDA